jgi:protein-disulfide isomerase
MEKHHKENQGEAVEPAGVVASVASSPKRDLFLPIAIIVAAFMVCGAIIFATLYKGSVAQGAAVAGTNGAGGGAPTPTAAPTNPAAVMALGARDAVLGSASAPVTLIEYGDYQCPFCAEFFAQTESQIIQNYVNSGKVKMVFRNFAFLGAESTAAAAAAECANDQNKLWAYHDALYSSKVADEAKGGTEDDGFYNRALFLKLAQQVGLDVPTFTTCIDTGKDSTVVAQEKGAAANDGVNSTPTFFINGQEISGAQPYTVFQSAIDSILQPK